MAGAGETDVPDGSQEQPILVNEDHDAPQSGIGLEVEKLVRDVQKGDARFNPIDLDGDDENLSQDPWRADEDSYDNDNAKIEREELANEPEDTQDGPCVHWKKGIRSPCPCGTHQKVARLTAGGIELGQSQVVELKESVRVGRYEAEFVEVYELWAPYKGDHSFLRGRTYARTRNLEGRIEPRKNEVCEIYELDENDHRATNPVTYLEQALVEVPVQNVKTIRTLHKTNKAFPECRFDRVRYRSKEEREHEAPLTCRWQMVLSYPDPRYRRQQRPIAGEVIRHYSQNDIPRGRHRVPDSERRRANKKIRGGSFVPNGAPEADREESPIRLAPGQKYTVVDIFCGAGGYSKGAEMAGLKVLAACDHWPWCCSTYRQNFPDAELHQEDVYKFIEGMTTDLTREHLSVDVLHFSPPCQTWSPAHTCEGKRDEANRATLFACEKIITIFKPRVFTVEQTFGLAQERWIPSFNALLQGFTRHGYSVRWKVLHLVEYGLPQTRKRLVMMGAAPGEQLPAWPRPTHSRDPKDGQKPFVSASEACSALVEGENLHDVKEARSADKMPWDSSKPLGRTITCSGGQCHHWSGRDFTLAEFSALQGFPVSFQFKGKCIKKQIGNAFAPVVVKVLLKSIRVHLENFDGVTRQPAAGQTIILSDDEDDNENHYKNRAETPHKYRVQSKMRSQLVVEDLVGFWRKSSAVSQDLLQGMIEDIRANPVQCFLAKANPKPPESDSSSAPSHRRSGRGGTRQAQPTQRNIIDSYFLPANDQNSPTAASTAVGGDSSAAPRDTEDSASFAVADDDTAAQDVTAGTSSAHFQIPSASVETTATHASGAGQTIVGGVLVSGDAAPSPVSRSIQGSRAFDNAAPSETLAQVTAGVREAARRSTIFPGLSDRLQDLDVAEDPAVPSEPGPQSPQGPRAATTAQSHRTGEVLTKPAAPTEPRRQGTPGNDGATPHQAALTTDQAIAGVLEADRHSRIHAGLAEAFRAAGIGGGADAAGPRDLPGHRDGTPRHDTPTPQSGLLEGAVGSAARQTGVRVAMASQDSQAGDSIACPSRRRSSGDSVAYIGESSRAGARRSLPFIVEDDEEAGDADEKDEDEQLQRAIRMSMGGVSVDRQGFGQGDPALTYQRSMLETHRPSQDYEKEDLYSAMDDDDDDNAPAPEPESDIYGPGDDKGKGKGKGKVVPPRTFDEYAEDKETRREGSPSKRPRGSK